MKSKTSHVHMDTVETYTTLRANEAIKYAMNDLVKELLELTADKDPWDNGRNYTVAEVKPLEQKMEALKARLAAFKEARKEGIWEEAAKLFPYDWHKDESCSESAGYPVYRANGDENWGNTICDLNTRLELNFADGRTINIWR